MFEIKNYMEDCVNDHLDRVINDCGGCTCELCRIDTAAIALNILPAKYIVTENGKLYSKLSALQQQFDVDIVSAIVQAVEIVKARPRHEEFEGSTNK